MTAKPTQPALSPDAMENLLRDAAIAKSQFSALATDAIQGIQRELGHARSQWVEHAPAIVEAVGQLHAFSKELARSFEQVAAQVRAAQQRVMTPEFQATLNEFLRKEKLGTKIEAAGWLPSRFAPFDLVEENEHLSDNELGHLLDEHFRDQWDEIEAGFRKSLEDYDVDEEAKATFVEALEAHRHGLYRAVPRTLFPEIERVVRVEFHGGELKRLTDQKLLRERVMKLGLHDVEPRGLLGMKVVNKFDDLYESIPTEERRNAVAIDPVPNRHASLHGLVAYRTAQTSLNALIMAEFMLSVISSLKREDDESIEPAESLEKA